MQTGTNFSESFTTIYEDELSFLEKTVDDYPVSALSLFLLLQNYKKTGNERYDHLIQKAALYFPNHTWLNYQLSEDDSMKYVPMEEIKEEEDINPEVEEEDETNFEESELYQENKPEQDVVTSTENNLEEQAIHEMEKEEMVEFVRGEEAENLEESFVEKESITKVEFKEEEDIDSGIEEEQETSFEESKLYPENKSEQGLVNSTENNLEEQAIHEMEKEEMVEFVRGEEAENFEESFVENELIPKEETITETIAEENQAEDIEEEISVTDNLDEKDLPRENILKEIRVGNNEETEVPSKPEEITALKPSEALQTDPVTNQEKNVSTSPKSEEEQEKSRENQQLEFEPLHTIDYFASQGIIIREEALMNDKLGKQMKSFTDWLKSMKKLHPGKLPEQNEVVEKIIQSSAELSNEDAGILTEAMADVLIKQGKQLKAIEMFQKLSLMNPSKSIYFAAKIESLKK